MTGPEHFVEAEELAAKAEAESYRQGAGDMAAAHVWATLALAHAQLATAAATALQVPGGEDAGMRVADVEAWEAACSVRPYGAGEPS